MLSFYEERTISIQTIHVPGFLNIFTDEDSRLTSDLNNFKLYHEFLRKFVIFGHIILTFLPRGEMKSTAFAN